MKKFLSSILATAMMLPSAVALEPIIASMEASQEIQEPSAVSQGELPERFTQEVLADSSALSYEAFRTEFFKGVIPLDKDGYLNGLTQEDSDSEEDGSVESLQSYHQAPIHVEGEAVSTDWSPYVAPYTTATTYGYGDGETHVRNFYVGESSTSSGSSTTTTSVAEGELIAMGEHVNIWLVAGSGTAGSYDTFTDTESLVDGKATDEKALALAEKLDNIYSKVTSHVAYDGVLVKTGSSNIPTVGDMDEDGTIHVLLLDIDGDSGNSSYTAGLFHSGCFLSDVSDYNPVDSLMMDIGVGQGFDAVSEDVSESFYGTFAHELQHLLYYVYVGHLLDSDFGDVWFNESLSGVPDQYYADYNVSVDDWAKGTYPQDLSVSRALLSMGDSYGDDSTLVDWSGSSKNYGMGYLLSAFMMNHDQDYLKNVYGYFQGNLEPITDDYYTYDSSSNRYYDNFTLNQYVGDVFQAVLQDQDGVSSLDSDTVFDYVYQAFLESYISGGGKVMVDGKSVATTEEVYTMYDGTMWGLKQGYIENASSAPSSGPVPFYSMVTGGNSWTLATGNYYTVLSSGGTVSTSAYEEKTLVLDYSDYSQNDNILSIEVADKDGLLAYVVLHDSSNTALVADGTGSYTINGDYKLNGDNGTLYPLTLGKKNYIDLGENTDVKPYVFVASLKDVTAQVDYSFVDEIPEEEESQDVAVTSVTLDKASHTLVVGGSVPLKATVLPSNATDKTLTWTSSNEAIATVNSSGVVSAVSTGSSKITAISNSDGGIFAECWITVSSSTDLEHVNVYLDGNGGSFGQDDETEISLDKNITLTSAIIDGFAVPSREGFYFNGWFTLPEGGTKITTSTTLTLDTVIYAQWLEKTSEHSHVLSVSLDPRVMAPSLPSDVILSSHHVAGDMTLFTREDGTVANASLPSIQLEGYDFQGWYAHKDDVEGYDSQDSEEDSSDDADDDSSDDSEDDSGNDGGALGDVTEETTDEDSENSDETDTEAEDSDTEEESDELPGDYVLVDNTVVFTKDSTIYPLLTATPEVESDGLSVTGVSLNKSTLTIANGETSSLVATVTPDTAENPKVRWTSSNIYVATVNYLGVVTGRSEGTTTITVTTIDGGFSASCEVTVTHPGFVLSLDAGGGYLPLEDRTLSTSPTGYVTDFPTPSRDYFVFEGWFTTRTGGMKVDSDTKFLYGQTIYAQWSRPIVGLTGVDSLTTADYYTNSSSYTGNGTVSLSPQTGKVGENVYISVEAYSGYAVKEVLVTRMNTGVVLDVTSYGNGNYSFEQPGSAVRVTATFVKVASEVPTVSTGKLNVPVIGNMSPSTYADVNTTDWYYYSVKFCYDRGLMSGMGDGFFAPEMETSRAMILQVLYNMAGSPEHQGSSFQDVSPYEYYANAVSWGTESGIITGIGDNLFAPDMSMSREQLLVMLYAYHQYLGGYGYLGTATVSFQDLDTVNTWAKEALYWAVSRSIVQNEPDGDFRPQETATRSEVAQILKNFVELYL